MTSSVGSSILASLGAGTVNTAKLVTDLVSATREPRETVITSQQSLNNARISAMGSAISSLDTFANALTEVMSGPSYTGTPNSSNSGAASVSLLTGGTPAGLPAQLTIQALATSRVYSSATVTSSIAAPFGTGTLTLTTGSGSPVSVVIDSSNNSFAGVAAAINNANVGVTATVVTDVLGVRLVFKGQTGAANDFTMSSDGAAGSILAGLDSNVMASTSAPGNAKITLDGIQYEYANNVIDDAIPYMRIELNQVTGATGPVTLSMTQPTATTKDLLKEFVDAYNTLLKALNTATAAGANPATSGVLNGVSSIRDMKLQLSAITSMALATSGPYRSLSDIGITTNRDGTLKLDTVRLDAVMAADPEAITNMLNPRVSTSENPGLAKIMTTVRDNITKEDGPLKLAQERYQKMSKTLTEQMEKLDVQMENYKARLSIMYSAMETRLTAMKATQSYLTQQVAMWTKSND